MKCPDNQQLVMVTLKNGEIEVARYYARSVTYDGTPAYEVPGGLLTEDEVVKWRPLTRQEIMSYGLDTAGDGGGSESDPPRGCEALMTITEAIEREQRNTLRLIEILNRLDELNKSGRIPKAKIAELVGKVEGIVRRGEAIDRGIAGAMEAKETDG